MKCRIVQNQMVEAMEETLDARRMAEHYAHLRQCTSCREQQEALQRVDSLLRHAPLCTPAPGFAVRLRTRLAHHRSRPWSPHAILFVALSTILVFGLLFLPVRGMYDWAWYGIQNPNKLTWLQQIGSELIAAARVVFHVTGMVLSLLFHYGWWLPPLGYGLLACLIVIAWMGVYSLGKVRRRAWNVGRG